MVVVVLGGLSGMDFEGMESEWVDYEGVNGGGVGLVVEDGDGHVGLGSKWSTDRVIASWVIIETR